MTNQIIDLPLITLSTQREQRASIEASLGDYGVVLLALSKTEAVALHRLTQDSRRFFELPNEAKKAYSPGSMTDWNGYFGARSTGLDAEGDDFERIAIPPGFPETLQLEALARDWPRLYETANQVIRLLIEKCRQLNRALSSIIGVDPNQSDQAWFDQHSSHLAINYYPRSTTRAIAAHRDFGGLSLVHVGIDHSGLQLTTHGGAQWRSVGGSSQSTVIAMLGELYSYWTDGLWPAAHHRVANPSSGRISIVLFHTPNRQSELATARGANPKVQVESFLSALEQRYLRIR